jgi:hypothetical protein
MVWSTDLPGLGARLPWESSAGSRPSLGETSTSSTACGRCSSSRPHRFTPSWRLRRAATILFRTALDASVPWPPRCEPGVQCCRQLEEVP